VIVVGALALSLVLALSACGRRAGPYAPPPPDPATHKPPELGPDGTRKFLLDPILNT
jgi:predicted small lipoprotein YifL